MNTELKVYSLLDCDAELNPLHPEEMEYHEAWNGGMYQLLKQGRSKFMFVSGSGTSGRNYAQVGEQFRIRDYSTLRLLPGVWTVVANAIHDEVGSLYVHMNKASAPVRCYK